MCAVIRTKRQHLICKVGTIGKQHNAVLAETLFIARSPLISDKGGEPVWLVMLICQIRALIPD